MPTKLERSAQKVKKYISTQRKNEKGWRGSEGNSKSHAARGVRRMTGKDGTHFIGM